MSTIPPEMWEELAELRAENEKLRRKVRYLELVIAEEVAHLSQDERDELDELRRDESLT